VPMITATENDIRAAALDYNEDFPEIFDAIRTAPVEIRVIACRPMQGSRIRVLIVPIVNIDGSHAYACDPEVRFIRWFDGRISPADTAKRAAKFLGVKDAQVPVEYVTR
jgi:hypothetical protein